MAPLVDYQFGSLTIGCDVIEADKASEKLITLLPQATSDKTLRNLQLGLREMLINSVEHGSLEISFSEKGNATERHDYLEFILERQKQPEYAHRKVDIRYRFYPSLAAFQIRDQGKGFDHRKIMARAQKHETHFDLAHGRGLRMALRIFDRVRYNEKGNRVSLLKRI